MGGLALAAKPVTRRMVREILAHARTFGLVQEGDIPDEAAFLFCLFWLKGGCADTDFPDGVGSRRYLPNVTELARLAGVSRPILDDWLKSTDERKRALTLARESTADFLVDEATQLLDTATVRESGLAASKANWRKWLAGVYNRQTYGNQQETKLSISLSDLHLHAHAERKAIPAPVSTAAVGTGETVITSPVIEQSNSLSDIELA